MSPCTQRAREHENTMPHRVPRSELQPEEEPPGQPITSAGVWRTSEVTSERVYLSDAVSLQSEYHIDDVLSDTVYYRDTVYYCNARGHCSGRQDRDWYWMDRMRIPLLSAGGSCVRAQLGYSSYLHDVHESNRGLRIAAE